MLFKSQLLLIGKVFIILPWPSYPFPYRPKLTHLREFSPGNSDKLIGFGLIQFRSDQLSDIVYLDRIRFVSGVVWKIVIQQLISISCIYLF